ncbi:GLPGLI family protein [Flavobacterium capsici]|uniref:GLPGLI family protein n=1 Tax=Flavobacterium capsici TaxID=3075618 RepID=A0AA96EXJ8_9FLAO|nr:MULTISPECIES: GLPGLI family protein [unclassified Flavobacterium]WNM20016.1 GLPGLI family protein [Flavobacterium sp. PMR2A8]WNM21405.1 GLPGLI family protein [Flavobacterium sp. PMTSA4]
MKNLALLIFSLFSLISFAQKDFQGMAVYESKTSTSDFKSRMEGNKEITPEMQKMIEERMKKMFEKTFILNFDKSASIYKEEEKLDAPNQGGGMRFMSSMMGGGGTYYKNVKEKTYTVDKEFMGKEFLVKDSLPQLNWKMEAETRVIGGYNCFKATAVVPASKSDFRNFRMKNRGEKKEGEKKEETAKEEKEGEKKTNFLEELDMPKEITITAWYTPEIPVNQGPESYWGLPGLILEVNDGKTVILCSKIVLNSKEKVEIKAPKNGKVVTQKEYDETVMKKMEEMSEMNNGRGGFQMRMSR